MLKIPFALAGLVSAGVLAATVGTADATATNPCQRPGVVINGTAASETLVGTPGRDVINGNGGNDTILGLGGADVLVGGPGRDEIRGGPCNDDLFGGLGSDLLFGGAGPNDDGNGGPGLDVCDATVENPVSCQ